MDVCIVFVERTVAWNVKWHEGRKDLISTKTDQREKTPDRQKKKKIPGKSKRIFSSPKHSDLLWGPPSLLFNGCGAFIQVEKRPGRQVHHSPPSSVKFKNEWSYTSAPVSTFMASTGITLPLLTLYKCVTSPRSSYLTNMFSQEIWP
jgi:hypothetical protein